MENNHNYIIYDDQFEQDENIDQQQRQEYNQIVQFANNEELVEWFRAEDMWTRCQAKDYSRAIYQKQYYICKHLRRAAQCPAKLKVQTHKTTGEIQVFQQQHHNHDNGMLTAAIKDDIRARLQQNRAPAQIHDSLLREHGTAPTLQRMPTPSTTGRLTRTCAPSSTTSGAPNSGPAFTTAAAGWA